MLQELEVFEILLFNKLLWLIVDLALEVFYLLVANVGWEIIAYEGELIPQNFYVIFLIYLLIIIRHFGDYRLDRLQKFCVCFRTQF